MTEIRRPFVERIAFHLTIENGQRGAYRDEHRDVPDALRDAYLSSDAGIEEYSCFEKDGHVFGYMRLEDPHAIEQVMETSEAQSNWDEVMEPILEESEEIWMDEVYRMK